MDKEIESPKGYKNEDDLLKEILAEEPDFLPAVFEPSLPSNIVPIDKAKYEELQRRDEHLDTSMVNPENMKLMLVQPIEYVLYPVLPTQGLGFIYAATGVGKTLFALNVAYSIAGGAGFLKYKCPKPRKVLYIDGEMAFNQLHGRVMQIVNREGDIDFPKNLLFITPDKVLPFKMPQIDDESGQEAYDKIIDKHKVEVIIIDNLSTLSSIDENKANEWFRVQTWLLKLRASGKTVIVVHHAGKDKNGYRGTSKMLDCVDVAISLQPVVEEESDEVNPDIRKFKLVYQKNRIFGGTDAFSFEVQLHQGNWSYQSNEQTNIQKVVECSKAGLKQREISKELFIPQTTVCRLLKKARCMGLII